MKDQEHIIARARRGDADAFEQLVAAYRNQVFRLALRMCGNEADADEVAQAIDRLPEDMRTVLILSALENRPYEEIARITGSPVGTVKSRLNRARVKLAEILSRMREPSAEKRVQQGERRTAP